MFNFRIWFLRRPSPAGPDADPTRPGLEHRVSGQGARRSSIASARHRACVHSARALRPARGRGGPSARPQVSPEQECEARSRCRSLLGRDRYRPPGPAHVRGLIRAEHLECSRNSLCRRVSVLSRPGRPRPRPRRGHAVPLPACVMGAPRLPSPSASPAGSNPEIGSSMPLSRRASAIACATNEAG